MRDFRKLKIWRQGIEIVKQVYKLIQELPTEEKYGLQSQITRAATSVPSNIAEGCSRNSLEEIGMVSNKNLQDLYEIITIEEKMINSLINKIKQTKG